MEKKTNAHKRCNVCGREIEAGWCFCSRCGAYVVTDLSIAQFTAEGGKQHTLTIDELPGPLVGCGKLYEHGSH